MHIDSNKVVTLAASLIFGLSALLALPVGAATAAVHKESSDLERQLRANRPLTAAGQSATQLPDGSWLLLGGAAAEVRATRAALVLGSNSQPRAVLGGSMAHERSGHSATLLPDGTVLILGGTDADGNVVEVAEQFDPSTSSFSVLAKLALLPRTEHSATVLADGRLLLAGGLDGRNGAVLDAELYNPLTRTSEQFNVRLDAERSAHIASLLPSNSVLLWGGISAAQQNLQTGDLYEAATTRMRGVNADEAAQLATALLADVVPAVLDSAPQADGTNVAVDSRVVVRFAGRMAIDSLNGASVTLIGPSGVTPIQIVPAENGVLLFVTPKAQFLPASYYTLFINGARDNAGKVLPFTAIGFSTVQLNPTGDSAVPDAASTDADPANLDRDAGNPAALPVTAPANGSNKNKDHDNGAEEWFPEAGKHFGGQWKTGRHANAVQVLEPLQAAPGVTALAGQVLTLRGKALSNVVLSIGGTTAQTDESGRFLLTGLSAGKQVLVIEGNQKGGRADYGRYEVKVDLSDALTNVLDYHIWLSKLDRKGNLTISSPTTQETVLTSPSIPGLELRLPAGSVIRGHDGKIVTELNMTAIPTDRPPFPLPGVGVPVYFTIQPGAAVIQNISANKLQGAQLIYPNFSSSAAGTRIDFWNYDPRGKGWYIYGRGTVTADARQVVPDPGVAIYEFTGAMVSKPSNAPEVGPPCGPERGCGGDPVDLFTGLYLQENSDMQVDDVLPLEVRRSYRSQDRASRAFGVGSNLSYDMFLVGDVSPWTYTELILPDGGRVRYERTSPGTESSDAVYTAPIRGTQFDSSTISYTGTVACYWDLKLKTGERMCFPEAMNSTSARSAAANSISDRFGNTITLERDRNKNLTTATSPNGRTLTFVYDTANRITSATDNVGRRSTYEYDAGGRLIKAIMPDLTFDAYTHDSNGNILTVQNQRGKIMVKNEYYPVTATSLDWVKKQTYADGRTNLFSYILDPARPGSVSGGGIAKTDITDARNIVKRYVFDLNGLPISITSAFGLLEQQTSTIERNTQGLILSRTDPAGRKTAYTYDSAGNTLTKTTLAGTVNAATLTMTYGVDSQVTSVTDSLLHKTVVLYNTARQLTQVTDANNNPTKFESDPQGRAIRITNARSKSVVNLYEGPDWVKSTDPLNRAISRRVDGAGRTTAVTYPLGYATTLSYDVAGNVAEYVDAKGQATSYTYDPNANLTEVKDPKEGKHGYGYDERDFPNTYTDPLLRSAGTTYDGNHNVTRYVDNKGQGTDFVYDNLDRLKLVTYADASTITYTYDSANRVTRLDDSANGALDYTYDGRDRVLSATSVKGSVVYTYYANGLRKTLTVSGQPTIRYSYDPGNRLLRIDQDAGAANNNVAQAVVFAYDVTNRRVQTKLPNVYKKADGTVLGDLSYAYDTGGKRTAVGGTLARTTLAQSTIAVATVDKANRLTSWDGAAFQYDDNGNLTNDGVSGYVWNARNQLVQIKDLSGNVTAAFTYDALGRRQTKAVAGKGVGYVYDGQNVVQTLNGTNVNNSLPGNVLASYITGLRIDELFAASSGTGAAALTISYLTDALGSTIRLTDASGAKIVDYTYDAYGATEADAQVDNPFQYTGRENDGTGLYYYRARYYSPKHGRFVQSDPIGLKGGINTYAYVGGNPLTLVDPFGLAELNFFDKSETNSWNGANGWNVPGSYTVAGHGSQVYMYSWNSKGTMTPEALAWLILTDKRWGGKNIILASCDTGSNRRNGDPGFAEQLSKLLGVWVTAPTTTSWYGNGTMMGAAQGSPPFVGEGTGWVTHMPGLGSLNLGMYR